MLKLKFTCCFIIYILSLHNETFSQNVCVNYESIDSVIVNDSLGTTYYKQLFLKIYNEKARYGEIYGKIDDDIDLIQLINEDSISFKVVYGFIVKVAENGKNATINFEKDTSQPFERIILIYNNTALGHIKFSRNNQYIIFNNIDGDLYDFYQCLSKQNMIYLSNFSLYCTFEPGYLSYSFNKCLNNRETVPVINDILNNYKEWELINKNGRLALGPWDFYR